MFAKRTDEFFCRQNEHSMYALLKWIAIVRNMIYNIHNNL